MSVWGNVYRIQVRTVIIDLFSGFKSHSFRFGDIGFFLLHALTVSPNVLNSLHSIEAILHCTDVIPLLYWSYPSTVLMLSSTVLILSPKVLMLSPWMYWWYPPACADVILPLYWTTSTVLKLSPSITEAIPPLYLATFTVLKLSPDSTDVIPPMYWTTSNVLNNLHHTELTLYGVASPAQKPVNIQQLQVVIVQECQNVPRALLFWTPLTKWLIYFADVKM